MALPITFLSDYGVRDEFAGVVHAVIARICPTARVIDLSHGVPRHDVVAGARMLARAVPDAPVGVHLAVVDPEVGARRRAIALRTGDEGRLLVGPDNGLLLPAAERLAAGCRGGGGPPPPPGAPPPPPPPPPPPRVCRAGPGGGGGGGAAARRRPAA